MIEIKLPTGATLKITPAPFADAKALLQAMLAELKTVKVSAGEELGEMVKNMLATGLSSPAIDKALEACMARCTYNGHRIVSDTFEPEKAREDYLAVCMEVAKANIQPFMKSLYARFAEFIQIAGKFQA